MNSRHSKLFADYASGQISENGLCKLEILLKKDEQLRREFLEYMNVCAVLDDHAASSETILSEITELPFQPEEPAKALVRFPRWLYVAAAACLVIGATFWLFTLKPKGVDVMATVLANRSASVAHKDGSIPSGAQLTFNEIEIANGWISLRLPSGVIFDVYGPAEGHFESPDCFRLEKGRVDVDVGESGSSFVVATKTAEIVDLGTSFGVDAVDDSVTKVAVFSGIVSVTPTAVQAAAERFLLATGEGLQIGPSGIASRLMSMTVADKTASDASSLPPTTLLDIRDNLADDERQYYRVVTGGMREGASVFTSQSAVRWTKDPQSDSFPELLVGADLIHTFHNERDDANLRIDLTLRQPSTVHILFDQRYEAPEWLKNNFQDTGETVASGPWRPVKVVHDILPDSRGNFYITYKVWSKQVGANQPLSLGPAVAADPDDLRAMYGIAIKPL